MATESKIILTAEDKTKAAWDSLKRQGESALAITRLQVAGIAASFAGIFGGFAAASIYTAFVRETVSTLGSLKDLQEGFGATAEGLSQIRTGFAISGQPMEEMETTIKHLSRSMTEAKDPTSAAARAIQALGLNTADFLKLTPDQALIKIADAIQGFSDGTGKAAVITALLGKEGGKLIPVLNDISDAAGKYTRITQEQIEESDKFDKAVNRLLASFSDFKTSVGADVIPALNEIIDFTRRARQEYGAFVGAGAAVFGLGAKILGIDLDELKRAETEVSETFAKLTKARQELIDQRKLKESGLGIGFVIDHNIRNAQEDVARYTTELKEAIKNRDRLVKSRADDSGIGKSDALQGFSPDAPKKEAKDKKEDPSLGQDTAMAHAYAKAMEEIFKAQTTAGNAGRELTASQQALYDLMRQPEWERMPESWRQLVITQTAATVEAERVAAATKRLNDLLANTETAKLEHARDTMQFLADAFDRGLITAQQFEEAATAALGNVASKGKDEFQLLLDAIEGWGRDASKEIARVAFMGGLSFKSFGKIIDNIAQQIFSMILQQQLMGPLMQSIGGGVKAATGGEGGGTLFDTLSSLGSKFLGSFDVGTPYVPRTGLALIHEGEGILTREENARLPALLAGGSSAQNVTMHINVAGVADSRTAQQIGTEAAAALRRASFRNG